MSAHLPPELLAAFDRPGDPLEDPTVCDWLQSHPEHLVAFAALRARMRDVAAVPVEQSWVPLLPWWRRPPVAAAAAVLAIAVAWIAVASADSARTAPIPRPRLAPSAAVVCVRVHSTSPGAVERAEDSYSRGRFAHREITVQSHAGASSPSSPSLRFRSELSVLSSIAP